jgi:8-oxo-dGTP pyrophosphatase MutT (NUDIX family)
VIDQIRHRLAAYTPRLLENEGRNRAAVLVPLYFDRGELHVVFTKRTDRVQSHRGEVSFPGGAMDATDPDLTFTALREAQEEVGLDPIHVSVIGQIDDIVTVSDFHVSAYVGEIDPATSPYGWLPAEAEVAEMIEAPLSHLRDPKNLIEVPRTRNGELVLQEGIRFGDHIIWGATFRMLRNFMDIVLTGGSAESAALPAEHLPDPPSFAADLPAGAIEGPTGGIRNETRRVR